MDERVLDSAPLEPLDRELYAAFAASDHGMLPVSDQHSLNWSVAGNPDGVPVLYLHGGPGGGCNPIFRRFFDPRHYRVIMLDQRGCGRSQPYASAEDNTSQALLNDIDALRQHLGIERWLLFGGSWGSTLALLVAQRWPERCLGLCLRGVFLGSQNEIDWFLNGIAHFYPERAQELIEALPEDERGDVLAAYHARLMHDDAAVHGPAAAVWTRYEMGCSSVEPRGPRSSGSANLAYATGSQGAKLAGTGVAGTGVAGAGHAGAGLAGPKPQAAKLVAGHPREQAPAIDQLPANSQEAAAQAQTSQLASGGSLSLARLEAHYMANGFFLEPGQIMRDMPRIAHIPGIIIHGRHDVICPPKTAYDLAAVWPSARLRIIAMGGHSALETAMRRALVGAMESFKTLRLQDAR